MAPPNETTDPAIGVKHPADMNPSTFSFSQRKLAVKGVTLLTDIPDNVSFSDFSSICIGSSAPPFLLRRALSRSHNGGFFGFSVPTPSDRQMSSLGRFVGRSFLSVFRFKTWWSTMWVGSSGSDLQMETQWVLFDVPEVRHYALLVPLIEGKFRSALHPGENGHVMLCAESGSSLVKGHSFEAMAYIHVSDNPFTLFKEAFTAIRVHLNSFRLLEEKTLPPLADRFGWCTWDAFYLTVEPAGIWRGVKEFMEAGVPLRFLIIDDGWQSINLDSENPKDCTRNLVLGGEQMTARLYRFEEGERFMNYKAGSLLKNDAAHFDPMKPKLLINKAIEIEKALKEEGSGVSQAKIEGLKGELQALFGEQVGNEMGFTSGERGLSAFTKDLRTRFKGLDDIYVWHALCGAWGGVRPGSTHLDAKIIPTKLSPGLDGTMDDLAVIKIVEGGIGLVHPDQACDFYDSMHSYLSKAGVTGAKIDVIQTLEYVGEDYGGRVELERAYYKGLTESMIRNFNGNGVISSMQQCNDFFFLGTEQVSMGRVGDDFWFQDPNGDPMGVYWLQGVHMIHCSYNSLWIGQMIRPDWDMFQSDHVCAKFHAGSRAICGGPVYLSDGLGGHNFDLIKKLVFPDGTIPRCEHYALPTRDCLFKNPLFDGMSILKIWNFNKFGGVLGVFNCQGAGWDPKARRIKGFPDCYKSISGTFHVRDIEWDQNKEAAAMGKALEYAVYLNQTEQLLTMSPSSKAMEITLEPLSFEIISFMPIRTLRCGARFSPVGLTNMFNNGGTIVGCEEGEDGCSIRMKVKGEGRLLVYSDRKPRRSHVNGVDVGFEWLEKKKVMLEVSWMEGSSGVTDVVLAC